MSVVTGTKAPKRPSRRGLTSYEENIPVSSLTCKSGKLFLAFDIRSKLNGKYREFMRNSLNFDVEVASKLYDHTSAAILEKGCCENGKVCPEQHVRRFTVSDSPNEQRQCFYSGSTAGYFHGTELWNPTFDIRHSIACYSNVAEKMTAVKKVGGSDQNISVVLYCLNISKPKLGAGLLSES